MRVAVVSGLLAIAFASPVPGQDPSFKIIVNAENPATALKREQIAVLFLNRSTKWSFGAAGAPVDQSMTAPVREAFTQQVLGLTMLGVSNHWHKRMLEARGPEGVPPPVKGSDEEVIAHVARSRGGIGYVSVSTSLPPTVKELPVEDLVR